MRGHRVFGDAALLVLDQSATGEDLVAFAAGGREPLVVWLDNLPAYLASGAITPSGVHQILARPGPVVVIATIVTVDYASIADATKATDALTQRGSTVLKLAEGSGALVHLDPTSADPEETAAARAAYPDEDLSEAGLAEQLAGAPALARQYATDLSARPVHRAACEVVIDWARVGFTRPIPHQVARDLTKARLPLRLQIATSDTDIDDALKDLCQPPAGPAGHTAALTPHPLDDDDQPGGMSEPRGFGYTPFPYLVAVDDGQDNTTPKPIPDSFWDAALHEAHTPADLTRLGYYASQHQQLRIAQIAWRHAADLGDGAAALGLGILLATRLDPPDLEGAAAAYREGIALGDGTAALGLGILLADQDPPDLEGAAAAGTGRASPSATVGRRSTSVSCLRRRIRRIWWVRWGRFGWLWGWVGWRFRRRCGWRRLSRC